MRTHLREHRHRLSAVAVGVYADVQKVAEAPFLTTEAWLPDEAVPLRSIELTWTPDAERQGLFPSDDLTEHLRPLKPDGTRYPSYSAAMAELAAPSVFQNRTTYRLRSVSLRGAPQIDFEPGRYFDCIDVGEACAHELAARDLGLIASTPLRDAIGDPVDLSARPTTGAIACLTLRHDGRTGEASFPLHWRDPAKVGHAGGTYMVVPVGVFQAANDDSDRQFRDLNLLACLAREYCEELLGSPEIVDDNDEHSQLERSMIEAIDAGQMEISILGMGTDPLTLATDLLAVATVDADLYDRLWLKVVAVNEEGTIIGDGAASRFNFSDEVVARLVEQGRLQAAAEALLRLAQARRYLRGHCTE